MSNLAAALFHHGRIETTLAKAKALRPFAEKVITLAKKAQVSEISADRIHFRRLAISQVQDEEAVKRLFTERVSEFMNRNGGYTRIYKLIPRRGDTSKMAIIELIAGEDKGYKKSRRGAKRKQSSTQNSSEPVAGDEDDDEKLIVPTTDESPVIASSSESPSVSLD
jgi:large subunit ribosomal protein L17